MPTKPTNNTPEFASDDNYTIGPKVGNPTKSSDFGATLATEGHVPGKDFPTSSNEFNAWLNASSLLTRWVFDGKNNKDLDAHIAETSSSGLLSAAMIDVGNTLAGFDGATVRNNASGSALRVITSDATQAAVRITSSNTTTTSPESIDITNDRTGFAAHMVVGVTDGGSDSLGGARFECQTDRVLATTGATSRNQAAINGLNTDGVAVEGISQNASQPAAQFLNVSGAGVSLRAGFGNEDSSPSNAGGNAIECRGGNGDATAGIDGGDGINARGGDAIDGTIDTSGGPGVFAKGGASATLPGGPGVHSQSTGTNSVAMVVDHGNANSSADLAQFNTGDNLANGIVVDCEGFGNGITVNAQGGSGLKLNQTPEGVGSTIFPHISMTPQDPPSTGPDITVPGDMWAEENVAGPSRLKYHSGGRQYVAMTNQPWCAASTHVTSATSVVDATSINIMTISFVFANYPDAVGDVIIKGMGGVSTDGTAAPSVGLSIWDDTAAVQIMSTTVILAPGISGVRSANVATRYTLPAKGARTFSIRYNLPNTSDGTFNTALNWIGEVTAAPE